MSVVNSPGIAFLFRIFYCSAMSTNTIPHTLKLNQKLSSISRVSYLNPKLHVHELTSKGGHGVLASKSISAGEIIAGWGGVLLSTKDLTNLTPAQMRNLLKIDDDLYDYSLNKYPQDMINHSCNPNSGFNENCQLIAIKQILPGQEVTFDYAMSDSDDFDEFHCCCGEMLCRGLVTGSDWKIPTIQKRYYNYFMPYLKRKIDYLSYT